MEVMGGSWEGWDGKGREGICCVWGNCGWRENFANAVFVGYKPGRWRKHGGG
jgi:hypothetical protein